MSSCDLLVFDAGTVEVGGKAEARAFFFGRTPSSSSTTSSTSEPWCEGSSSSAWRTRLCGREGPGELASSKPIEVEAEAEADGLENTDEKAFATLWQKVTYEFSSTSDRVGPNVDGP